MRSFNKNLLLLLVTALLAACGGGGGDSGTPSSGTDSSTGGGTAVVGPVVTMQLANSAGTVLSGPYLSQTETSYLKITVADAKGVLKAYSRVDLTLDNTLAVVTPQSGSQLTDENGVALFAIVPASVTSSGAVTATAKVNAGGIEASKTLDLQLAASNVVLSDLFVSPSSVQKGQSVNVSVNAIVNGVTAASNSVSVSFSSACGTVSPLSALVDSAGKASAVIQTSTAGGCSVSATTTGAGSPVVASFTVNSPPITGIQFVQANPTVIYQADSPGTKTSLVKFKVLDSNGNPVSGQNVNASLVGDASGTNFCGGSSAAVSDPTTGEVTFAVCGGTQPTTVQVRAMLSVNGTSIYTDSNILTVQTGLPTQRFFDISATQLNFYAGGYFTSKFNGNTVPISVFAADRQGNPVPDGTPVVFVSEGGQINSSGSSSCLITNGRCSVELIGQDYRPLGSTVVGADPRPGRVTVLAMTDGEESFVDANNNNRYDPGELFEDLGRPFLDKDEDRAFTASYRNLILDTNEGEVAYAIAGGAVGSSKCPSNSNIGFSQANTCNSQWNGSGLKPDGVTRYVPTKVRRAMTIVFSGGEIGLPGTYDATIPSRFHTAVLSSANSGVTVRLADLDGNPLPADAALKVAVRQPEGGKCAATLNGAVIGSSTEPTSHTALLEKCVGDESLDFTVTVSTGGVSKSSTLTVRVPAP